MARIIDNPNNSWPFNDFSEKSIVLLKNMALDNLINHEPDIDKFFFMQKIPIKQSIHCYLTKGKVQV